MIYRSTAWALLAGVLQVGIGSAQPQGAEVGFSAASIKVDVSRRMGGSPVIFKPGGRLVADGVTVRQLIAAAYGLQPGSPRLGKGPDWTATEKYVVEAVAEDGSLPGRLSGAELREKMQPMLRRLLAERFKLVIRRESKEMGVFSLTAAPAGSKLTKASATEADCALRSAGGENECHHFDGCATLAGCRGEAVSMADLASLLENYSDRPVVDETGTAGLFSIQLRHFGRVERRELPAFIKALPPEAQPDLPSEPSMLKVVEQDLGLQLRQGRARVETLVIESIEKPSAN